MAISHHDIALGAGKISLLDTMRSYLVQYLLALYLLSGAAVALGFALNWN
jgi:hypothetical protein